MFDFDASKLLIVGVIALIFIPPKDLPRVLRQVGQFVGKMRRMANEFQGQFMDAMREADISDLREEARKLANAAKVDIGLDAVADLGHHLTGAIEGKPVMMESTPSPVEPARTVDVDQQRSPPLTVESSGAVASSSTAPVDAPGLVHAEPVTPSDGARSSTTRVEQRAGADTEASAVSSSA